MLSAGDNSYRSTFKYFFLFISAFDQCSFKEFGTLPAVNSVHMTLVKTPANKAFEKYLSATSDQEFDHPNCDKRTKDNLGKVLVIHGVSYQIQYRRDII